jgi:glycosyltransferase involved in cell wall biosynthesis
MKVSAIVSLYKAREFVEACLIDLVNQSLYRAGGLEIVVIDSASPDDEGSVVREFQKSFANIVYHRTDERERLYQAWNRGVAIARGEYITNANADDRHHPECLEILARALDSNPRAQLVYADVFESQTPNESFSANSRRARYLYKEYFAPEALLHYQFGCQPLWRRGVHERVGLFSETMKAAGDWEFNLRFALAGERAIHLPIPLGVFLARDTSISTQDDSSVREQRELREQYLNCETILSLYRAEGWPLASVSEQAGAFTDFARRATHMTLPWEPDKVFSDAHAALLGCARAFEITAGEPRASWNLGVALHRAARQSEALPYLQRASEASDAAIKRGVEEFNAGRWSELAFV